MMEWKKGKQIFGVWIFFEAQQNLSLKKSAGKDKEIRCHQPSSPATASSCPIIAQMSPLTFVAVAVAVEKAVAVAVTVVVAKAVAVAVAVRGWWQWQWQWW